MATLLREVERPAFLDERAEQLAFPAGAVAAPARGAAAAARVGERGGGRALLSERSRAEPIAEPVRAARGGGATLDELLVGAWEGMSARRPVACVVCAGTVHVHPEIPEGVCGDCGSQLR